MMRGAPVHRACLCAAVVAVLCPSAAGQAIVLKKKFVEKFRNRATIDSQFIVDDFSAIHSQAADGDIHIGGRSKQVGLPLVAEIVNARKLAPAVKVVRDNKGNTIALAGAWRLWFEHPPKPGEQQVQKKTLGPVGESNSPHVFEIHPVTQAGNESALSGFVAIPDYKPYEAEEAFELYEKRKITVKANSTTIALSSKTTKLNYARFGIKLRAKRWTPADGEIVLADVLDEEGNPVPTREPIRMVFVKGTKPYDEVKQKATGSTMQVIGLPRVNLDEVFAVAPQAQQPKEIALPYEMIILAVVSGS